MTFMGELNDTVVDLIKEQLQFCVWDRTTRSQNLSPVPQTQSCSFKLELVKHKKLKNKVERRKTSSSKIEKH